MANITCGSRPNIDSNSVCLDEDGYEYLEWLPCGIPTDPVTGMCVFCEVRIASHIMEGEGPVCCDCY